MSYLSGERKIKQLENIVARHDILDSFINKPYNNNTSYFVLYYQLKFVRKNKVIDRGCDTRSLHTIDQFNGKPIRGAKYDTVKSENNNNTI